MEPVLNDPRLPERFWQYVEPDPETGCWVWRASRNPKGYGQFRWKGRMRLVHRVTWDALVEPLPPYHPRAPQLDHCCENTGCANPAHLELVPPRVNTRRSSRTVASRNAAKTACPAGHRYAGTNLRMRADGSGRTCRECERNKKGRRRAALVAA